MRNFGTYPITVNYNLHTRLRYQHNEDDLHRAGRYVEEKQLDIKVNTSSDATIENNLWNQELTEYEQAVCNMLRKVEGNPVGRMVLGLINKQTTVWIIPKSDAELKADFSAQTWPLNYDIQPGSVARGVGSGDTVILFDPKLGDDTLLHELVHAYRYSHKKFNPICIDIVNRYGNLDCGSSEEFLAHQMENIYMSQANRPLTTDYYPPDNGTATKDEIYDFLLQHVDRMEALKYFLRHEYLAMLAAHTFTNTAYNPFRDYGTLEAKLLQGFSISTLPELGAPPVQH
jgi:hypothetical protein